MDIYNQFEPQKLINLFKLFPFSLAIYMTFIGFGIKTSINQLINQPLLPKNIVIIGFFNYFLIPSIITILGLVFSLPPLMIIALLLISCSQGGGVAYITTWLLKGNQYLQLWQILFNTLLAVIAVPLVVTFFSQFNPQTTSLMLEIKVDHFSLFFEASKNIFIPFFIGMSMRQLIPQLAGFLANKMIIIGIVIMAIFLTMDYSMHFVKLQQYWDNYYYALIAYNFFILALTFSIPMALGYGYKDSIAIALGSSQLNFFLIMGVLDTYFKSYTSIYMTVLMWSWTSLVIPIGLALLYFVGRLGYQLFMHYQRKLGREALRL